MVFLIHLVCMPINGTIAMAACHSSLVDIWNLSIFKIVHIFETKKLMKSLLPLCSFPDQIYLLSEEEKENEKTWSVISIETDYE